MFGRRHGGGATASRPIGRARTDTPGRAEPPRPRSADAATATAPPAVDALPLPEQTSERLFESALLSVRKRFRPEQALRTPPAELSAAIAETVAELADDGAGLDQRERQDIAAAVLDAFLEEARREAELADDGPETITPASRQIIDAAKNKVQPILLERIDISKASSLSRAELEVQISDVVAEILSEEKLHLNHVEQRDVVAVLLNEMLGLGPLEVLLADETVTDIMVNGAKQVYVERGGKLELTNVTFRNDAHVMNIATRIVSRIGRRVDETTPLVDARLADGSRVNIIIAPLALDGPSISIRKFSKKKITLDTMERQANISADMAKVLKIASRCRLNILISGGTGSGKTTLLNALSRMIDAGERIVTIEDAAELQLQQPHVVRLETRPANLEGEGEITQRDLVRNALRMRPDRIILGEIRAGEALDMLQAMNTGHDGSMCTIHANRPREALTRLENMVAMTGVKLPNEAVRSQIAGAINMIVQISRMRDGVRRITYITEVVGMEGEVVTTQDLFTFEYQGEDAAGRLQGVFKSSGLRPHFTAKAEYYGLDRALMQAMSASADDMVRA